MSHSEGRTEVSLGTDTCLLLAENCPFTTPAPSQVASAYYLVNLVTSTASRLEFVLWHLSGNHVGKAMLTTGPTIPTQSSRQLFGPC